MVHSRKAGGQEEVKRYRLASIQVVRAICINPNRIRRLKLLKKESNYQMVKLITNNTSRENFWEKEDLQNAMNSSNAILSKF